MPCFLPPRCSYVAHLASRLLEVSREDRAAHVITQALRARIWAKKYGEWIRDESGRFFWARDAAMWADAAGP